MNKPLAGLAFVALLPMIVYGQCISKQDYRIEKKGGIVIEQVELSGTQAIDSAQINDVTGNFVGSCFNDNAGEIGERIRDQFQQRGYFKAKVDNLTIKARDPLRIPKPVSVVAEVVEGPLYTLSQLDFVGNRAFTTEQLAGRFPLKRGDPFKTDGVRSGLNALRTLYGSQGYLDFRAVPMPEPHSDPTVALKVSVDEGKQYRMGELEFIGQKDTADLLKTKWSLKAGAPFDTSYLIKFVEENKSALPEGFSQRDSIRAIRNCREQTVAITVALDKQKIPSQPATDIDCEEQEGRK